MQGMPEQMKSAFNRNFNNHQTFEDESVTVQNRDSGKQESRNRKTGSIFR